MAIELYDSDIKKTVYRMKQSIDLNSEYVKKRKKSKFFKYVAFNGKRRVFIVKNHTCMCVFLPQDCCNSQIQPHTA